MNSPRSQGLRASSATVREAAHRVIAADDAARIDTLGVGIRAVAEIFRGAAATVPLPLPERRKRV